MLAVFGHLSLLSTVPLSYFLRHALQITAHGGINLWNLDLCAGPYRTYRSSSDESIAGLLAILQITAPTISHNTTRDRQSSARNGTPVQYPPVDSHQQSSNLNWPSYYSRANDQPSLQC